MYSKPVVQSWTVWLNVLMPVLALAIPGAKDLFTPELEMAIITVANVLLRVFKTDKPIDGVV